MPYMVLDPATAAAAPIVSFGAPEASSAHPTGKSLAMMRERIKLEIGNRSDIPSEIYNEWINDAYLDIYSSLELPESHISFSFQSVANQALYKLPPSVDAIIGVTGFNSADSAGGSLEKKDLATYRKLPIACGEPEYWLREQNMLILWATPDAAYRIVVEAAMRPALLTADAHYPILEDKWHELIVKSAKARAWEGIQNSVKSLEVENAVSRFVARKVDRTAREEENEYPALRVVTRRDQIMNIRNRAITTEPGD